MGFHDQQGISYQKSIYVENIAFVRLRCMTLSMHIWPLIPDFMWSSNCSKGTRGRIFSSSFYIHLISFCLYIYFIILFINLLIHFIYSFIYLFIYLFIFFIWGGGVFWCCVGNHLCHELFLLLQIIPCGSNPTIQLNFLDKMAAITQLMSEPMLIRFNDAHIRH